MNKKNKAIIRVQNLVAHPVSGNRVFWHVLAFGVIALSLPGCNSSFHDLGTPPVLSPVNSTVSMSRALISPAPDILRHRKRISMTDNGLWDKREGVFFRDTRAYGVGDILTVSILMNDSAQLNNRSDRDSSLTGSLTGAGTYTLPNGFSPAASLDASLAGRLGAERGGTVKRSEKIRLQVAVIVVASSSNGNLQVSGSQEIRVNHELRILTVQGVVRSKDILPDNTIPYEKVAEARISYGGNNTRRRGAGKWRYFRRAGYNKSN